MSFCRKILIIIFALITIALLPDIILYAAMIDQNPLGKGSLPTLFFSDGTVCLVDPNKSNVCRTRLLKIPQMVMKAHSATFYGVFDVDGDGSPEVFFDYWSPFHRKDGDNVVILVYKKIRGKYRQYLRLKAESHGYNPGAWFLNEPSHPKAVFMTRSGGSSGSGLFYLNLKKKSLDLISGPIILEGLPEFLDIDGDGISEVFLPGRGRDRTSQPGAGVLRWNKNGYEMWWPNWTGTPNVIYATVVDVDGDQKKEVVAILEPQVVDFDKQADGKTLSPRELAVWKVTTEGMVLLSRSKLPDAKYLFEPMIGLISSLHPAIELKYIRTVGCTLQNGEITCGENK